MRKTWVQGLDRGRQHPVALAFLRSPRAIRHVGMETAALECPANDPAQVPEDSLGTNEGRPLALPAPAGKAASAAVGGDLAAVEGDGGRGSSMLHAPLEDKIQS